MKAPWTQLGVQTARKRLADALRHFDAASVSKSLLASAVIQGGILVFWAGMAAVVSNGILEHLAWFLLLPALLACGAHACLRAYHRRREELARWQEQVLLDCGVYVDVFDQQVELPRRGWWTVFGRSAREKMLSSNYLSTRIQGLIEFFPEVCRELKIQRQPPALVRARRAWLWLGSAALLALPLAVHVVTLVQNGNIGILWHLLEYSLFGDVRIAAYPGGLPVDGSVYFEHYYDPFFVFRTLAVDVFAIGAIIFSLAWFTLLLPFQRLFGVIERASLRQVMHDIVLDDQDSVQQGAGMADKAELERAALRTEELSLAAQDLRRKVGQTGERLKGRSLRLQ